MMGTRMKGKVSVRWAMGAALAASLLLSGCVSFSGKAPDQLISLTPDVRAPAGEIGSGTISAAMVVLDPDTDRRLDVTRVPVQIDKATIAYLKDAVWVEKPARQFRRLMAETLRVSLGEIVVEGSDYEVTGGTVLSGRLVDMGYDASEKSVIVRYDALLQDRKTGAVRSRRFEAEIPGVPAKAKAVAPALNEAANTVVGEVAEWIGEGAPDEDATG